MADSTNMLFSLIIPTRGRPLELEQCLESLCHLAFPPAQYEVIVVDDGSPLQPEALVHSFQNRLPVSLLTLNHAGPAAARNLGARHAKGRFLAFTDDDCHPEPGWLEALALHFSMAPDVALIGRTVNALGDNLCSAASQQMVEFIMAQWNPQPTAARFGPSNNLAVPSEAFRAVGGFDVSFPLAAGEDREFLDRWRRQGFPIHYVETAVVRHFHNLTLAGFWRQHFNYGRGACIYRRVDSCRAGQSPARPSLALCLHLVRAPLEASRGLRAWRLAGLLAMSQVATAAGFLAESRRGK